MIMEIWAVDDYSHMQPTDMVRLTLQISVYHSSSVPISGPAYPDICDIETGSFDLTFGIY